MKLFRSLKSKLALYFIPLCVIPVVALGVYAAQLFTDHTQDNLVRMAQSERDALLSDIQKKEALLLAQTKAHAADKNLVTALADEQINQVKAYYEKKAPEAIVRIYDTSGRFKYGRKAERIDSSDLGTVALNEIKSTGEYLTRTFSSTKNGYFTINQVPVKNASGTHIAIIEEGYLYGGLDMGQFQLQRQVEAVILDPKNQPVWSSFSLPAQTIDTIIKQTTQENKPSEKFPIVSLGEERYGAFLAEFPSRVGKQAWGKIILFASLTHGDAAANKLNSTIATVTLLIALLTSGLIILFSNRIVSPIVSMVLAMRKSLAGKLEPIPQTKSTFEIDYLVRSFNEMTANIEKTQNTLELKLEELHLANSEITETQDQLVQSAKMASLGQLVAGVAHELNNPIGFIYSNLHHLLGYVRNLKGLMQSYESLREDLPAEKQKYLDEKIKEFDVEYIIKDIEPLVSSCQEGAERIKDIVLGLRTFSRVGEGVFTPSDINQGIQSTVKILASEFKSDIKLHEEYGVIPPVECNLPQLNQVFLNLMTNAAQSLEGRGDIWIRTWKDGENVFVQIEDNGKGLPASVVEKVFDPFFTTKKVGEGTGLGLSIAYGLVQKHHGEIQVHSESGEGAIFTVILPILQPTKPLQQTS